MRTPKPTNSPGTGNFAVSPARFTLNHQWALAGLGSPSRFGARILQIFLVARAVRFKSTFSSSGHSKNLSGTGAAALLSPAFTVTFSALVEYSPMATSISTQSMGNPVKKSIHPPTCPEANTAWGYLKSSPDLGNSNLAKKSRSFPFRSWKGKIFRPSFIFLRMSPVLPARSSMPGS